MRLPRRTALLIGVGLCVCAALTQLLWSVAKAPQAENNHTNIITTVFWVGEPGDADNGNIPNAESAWDGTWQQHYGGVDTPDARNGFNPSGFLPKENPFYVALPYNDLTFDGSRKASARSCRLYSPKPDSPGSWCKNTWIAVTHKGRTAYGQWEDVGPFEEDDAAYVFDGKPPRSTVGAKAGLDVSPAVRDYLELSDVDRTDWLFVRPQDVPPGPWKTISTSSQGYSIE